MAANETFDFVIVGAGSAGCVLANRLTEDGRTSVLLLEYGGSDRSVLVQMPSALSFPMNRPRYNWGYASEPEPHLDGRRINTPRGKVLGGSSSINGLVYVRGNAQDSTAGTTRAPAAGRIVPCCPTSRGLRLGPRAAISTGAATGRFTPA